MSPVTRAALVPSMTRAPTYHSATGSQDLFKILRFKIYLRFIRTADPYIGAGWRGAGVGEVAGLVALSPCRLAALVTPVTSLGERGLRRARAGQARAPTYPPLQQEIFNGKGLSN